MNASFKARYEPETAAAAVTLAVRPGDFKLKASVTDATFVKGPSLNGLSLGVEKPGFFIVDYNVPKSDFRFQFMNTVRVAEKPLKLTYIHRKGDGTTILEGDFAFDASNKISANHVLGTNSTRVKYTYVHGGLTKFEPSYDFKKSSWDFSVSRPAFGDDVFKATYHTSSKDLFLEWSRNSKINGSFKILASVNLAEERKNPRLIAETTWDFEA